MKSAPLLALACLLAAGTAGAVGAPKGNAALGKQKFEATPQGGQACASCHLEGGAKSIDGNTPLLAGQYADYLAKALKDYRSGERVNVLMNAQIGPDGTNPLTDADIQNITAYLASQKSPLHIYEPAKSD